MAKRKRVALFEVINKDTKFGRKSDVLRTPSWWDKRSRGAKPAAVDPPPTPFHTQRIIPDSTRPAPTESAPPAPSQFARLSAAMSEAMSDVKSVIVRLLNKLSPHVTPASGGIVLAAVIVALGTGWILNHRSHLSTTQKLLQSTAHPEVLNIGSTKPPVPFAQQATPAAAVEAPARQANLYYLLIHLYDTQAAASRVSKALTDAGIPCTVERNVPGVQPQFFAVVGLNPFGHAGSADYTTYVQNVKTLLTKLQPPGTPPKIYRVRLIKWAQ
jgi:hypothetical protein